MNYLTYDDLLRDVRTLANQVRDSYDCVCGVPSSGVLAASVLALELHCPMISLRELIDCSHEFESALVVDDSLYMGTTIGHVRYLLSDRRTKIKYAVIYDSPVEERRGLVDFSVRVVQAPRYFAWNLFHHPDLSGALLDIDGVLCEDPAVTDDDGPEYEAALRDAVPLHLPGLRVGGLVTCRLERWRILTETWLHGRVRYGSLHMSPYATADERRAGMDYAEYKADVLRRDEFSFMIESDDEQASKISELTKKPVICVSSQRVHQ